jgi:hypothetical protein
MRPIPKSKLVWVNIPAGTVAGAAINFPDVPELRDKPIIGVEAYNLSLLAATPDLVATISAADLVGVTVTLKDYSDERVQDIPASTLVPTNIAGLWKQFVPFVVNWQASFLRFVATPAGVPCSFPLNVFYLEQQ